jgi:type I restriction enzyme M protein
MYEKNLIKKLHFSPKEKTINVFYKTYTNGYTLEVDFENGIINYGNEIKSDSKTTQNFSQPENFVVLECVDRLLVKGYKPKDITLEKVFPSGHGHSGRLDILVKNSKKSFLMIECKTYGKEFDKEFVNIQKNGGQLFTYFQNDTNTDYLMLYASVFSDGKIESICEIVKIEESYRTAGNVEDVYNRWNKITYNNGIFDDQVEPYTFQNKLLTLKDLKPITINDSGVLFHGFASILRKHSVSDKPNAFNKIFNLFLAKIYDEGQCDTDRKRSTVPLDFQWKEGIDTDEDFQIRLINLHKEGVKRFLEKEIEGLTEKEIENRNSGSEKQYKRKWLKFNKIFDIKDVNDDESFDDNARVLKEVVALLAQYQIRYPRRQQHLSDFFEHLLTTGLKQEAGQYFTPVPITRFIAYSLPLKNMIIQEVNQPNPDPVLPAVIDYAAGSGHFLTEILEMYQDIINELDTSDFYRNIQQGVKAWKENPYSWATKYIYGIEKDYRLVKVAKVGCYFYGDGLAQVIHGDGLDNFEHSKTYRGLLQKNKDNNPQFDIVVSNPPYSVEAFKGDLRNKDAKEDFLLFQYLTDRSSEIECLFLERTAQLLKKGGVAGIILPSSILSNTGIYTKTREILLQKFELIAITELGSNTFMATGTNTVVLFLRRRNDEEVSRLRDASYHLAETYLTNKKDLTTGGVEKPVTKYLAHTGETDLNAEKLFYFLLTYNQTVVLVKTGEKDAEKRFLGYAFSNRRGYEGIHPIQGGKSIDECTRLYDENVIANPQKASTYIYRAFNGDVTSEIDANLQDNVTREKLVDMLVFDGKTFDKTISTTIKKKEQTKSKWKIVNIGEVANVFGGKRIPKDFDFSMNKTEYPYIRVSDFENGTVNLKSLKYIESDVFEYIKNYTISSDDVYISIAGTIGLVGLVPEKLNNKSLTENAAKLVVNKGRIKKEYLYICLSSDGVQRQIKENTKKLGVPKLALKRIESMTIPLPPIDIQKKIVAEIEVVEKQMADIQEKIGGLNKQITIIRENIKAGTKKLSDLCTYSETRINAEFLTCKNYVGVDNILQNTAGKIDSNFVPSKGTATKYMKGDILLSNIRPYLRKIWYADTQGGSSNDVLVLQTKTEYNSKYIYYHLKSDDFFDYEMQAVKGMKMPRGDKQHILKYSIPCPSLPEQQKIVTEIEKLETKIQNLQKQQAKMENQKEQILKKHL